MRIINGLSTIQSMDKPQGFPICSFYMDGADMIINEKARKRLEAREIIAYLDKYSMRIYVSLSSLG